MDAIRFPGESSEYREARNELLRAELELRRRIEDVAALRRRLPLGGEVPVDYAFEEGAEAGGDGEDDAVRTVRMSELFLPGKDTLVLYSFMYGPRMERPCPMCTSLLDGLEGQAEHLRQRVGFAVVAKSPIQRVRLFARERGWSRLRLLSSERTTSNADYAGETPDGDQQPMLNVFARRAGRVHHAYATEMLFADSEPGQDPRHVDMLWPLWNVLDLTPDGRGEDWRPRLSYDR